MVFVDIEHRVRTAHPEVVTLFIKPQTASRFREVTRHSFAEPDIGI